MNRANKIFIFLAVLISLAAGVAGCNMPDLTEQGDLLNPTRVYQTVSAKLTLIVSPSGLPNRTPTFMPSPTTISLEPTITVSPLPTVKEATSTQVLPSATSIPCNLAAPGRPNVDVTVPDGTKMMPGQSFSKTWRLYNAGSCTWTREYAIVWFSGENFSSTREQSFSTSVKPGSSIEVTVDMSAPKQVGMHQSNWKLRNASGQLFGIGPAGDAPFWVRIEVEEVATLTATVQPTRTITPTMAVAARGSAELAVGKGLDLDTGKITPGTGEDLLLKQTDAVTLQLVPINGAVLADLGTQITGEPDCKAATLTENPISTANLKEGQTFCYRTSQVLPGYFVLKKLSLGEKKVTIEFLTWAIP